MTKHQMKRVHKCVKKRFSKRGKKRIVKKVKKKKKKSHHVSKKTRSKQYGAGFLNKLALGAAGLGTLFAMSQLRKKRR